MEHFQRKKMLHASCFMLHERGLTMLEFLLVAGITGIIAVVVLVNLAEGERNLAVRRSAQKVSAALREAQNMTLAGTQVGGQMPEGGFGVFFQTGQDPILFGDFDDPPNFLYETSQIPPEEQRTIFLDAGVTVSAVSHQHIVFFPPNPDVYMNGFIATGDATITLQYGSSSQTVRINSLGNISIE